MLRPAPCTFGEELFAHSSALFSHLNWQFIYKTENELRLFSFVQKEKSEYELILEFAPCLGLFMASYDKNFNALVCKATSLERIFICSFR